MPRVMVNTPVRAKCRGAVPADGLSTPGGESRASASSPSTPSSVLLGPESAIGTLHSYAVRMPYPKTADGKECEPHERVCLQQLLTGCLANPKIIMPLYGDYINRANKYATLASEPGMLVHRRSFGTMEDEVIIQHLEAVSKVPGKVLCLVQENNEYALKNLLEASMGCVVSLGIRAELFRIPVCLRFLKLLDALNLHPLASLKDDINDRLEVNFSTMQYKIDVEDEEPHKVTQIEFRNGDFGDLMGDVIDSTWAVRYPFSASRACFVKPPLAPKPLQNYFQRAQEGPYKLPKALSAKSQQYIDLVKQAADEVKRDEERLSPSEQSASESKSALSAVKQKKTRDLMDKARVAAKRKAITKEKQEVVTIDRVTRARTA